MPTWGELLQELNRLSAQFAVRGLSGNTSPQDLLRRKYLRDLSAHTKRATILYATRWLEPSSRNDGQAVLGIVLGDVQGFMEAVSNVSEKQLDLIITSPGGSPDAAESIVQYLRQRFEHIRAIVPVAAMSAATMISLATDEIVMGQHSQLGPIDPQFTITTPEGPRSAPGQAILDQFELAKQECVNPQNIGAWLPLLRSLAPGLLATCNHERERAKDFARRWLEQVMFRGEPDAKEKAARASAWFSNFTEFRSHGRRVGREEARAQGLRVLDLESDPVLQDLVLSVHHATRLTFNQVPATKIIENHHGRAYVEISHGAFVQVSPPPVPAGPTFVKKKKRR